MEKIERPPRWMVLLLIGVLALIFVDWGFAAYANKYQVRNYTQHPQTTEKYMGFLQGPIVLAVGDILERGHEELIAAATVGIFIVTTALAVYTAKLWSATKNLVKETADTTRTIERAYVQMSHFTKEDFPGLIVDQKSGQCLVTIGIKNHGTTPARVTRVFLTKRVLASPLPDIPEYRADLGERPEQPTEAFLMKDAEMFVGFTFNIDISDLPLFSVRRKQLVIYGFVDYTDQFGRDFRGGYARYYVPDLVPNNLMYLTQAKYNYDKERKRGQGNEWA